MRPPKVPEQPVPVLSTDEQGRLLAACAGAGFAARRESAMLRVFIDTGARLAEVTGLLMTNVDLTSKTSSSWARAGGTGDFRLATAV